MQMGKEKLAKLYERTELVAVNKQEAERMQVKLGTLGLNGKLLAPP